MSTDNLTNETQLVIVEKKGLILSKIWNILGLLAISVPDVSDVRNVSENKKLNDALKWQSCSIRPGRQKFSRLFWKDSNLITETNQTKMHFLAFSACQVCIAKNWRQLNELLFNFLFEKLDCNLARWNEATGFWGRPVCFSGKRRQIPLFGFVAMPGNCDGRKFSRKSFNVQYSAHWKKLIETQADYIEKVVRIRIESVDQLLKISAYQASGPRNLKENFTVD